MNLFELVDDPCDRVHDSTLEDSFQGLEAIIPPHRPIIRF